MFRTTDSIRWKDIFPKFVDSLESIHKAQSRLAIRCSYSFGEPTIHKAIERVFEEFSSLDGKDGERSIRNIIISYLTDSSTSRRFANLTSNSFPCRYIMLEQMRLDLIASFWRSNQNSRTCLSAKKSGWYYQRFSIIRLGSLVRRKKIITYFSNQFYNERQDFLR